MSPLSRVFIVVLAVIGLIYWRDAWLRTRSSSDALIGVDWNSKASKPTTPQSIRRRVVAVADLHGDLEVSLST